MDVSGKVVKKLDVESGMSKSEKEWKKQTIVINTGADYNPEIAIQAFGDDKIRDLDKLNVGDSVLIKCNVSSREYNGRYFHNIDGWFFSKKDLPKAGTTKDALGGRSEPSDDLPF